MRLYAVVGGIGSGKSTVCDILRRRYGVVVIDADRLGHRGLEDPAVKRQLLAYFGADIVGAGGRIERRRLGARVFGRPRQLRRLNDIVHPWIAGAVQRRVRQLQRQGTAAAVLDAALYFDVDLGVRVDAVLAVTAPRRVRRRRLAARDGLSAGDIEQRLSSQPRLGVWTRRADVRVDTACSLAELEPRVRLAWRELQRVRRQVPGNDGRKHDHGSIDR